MSFTNCLISAVALATLANSKQVKFGVLTDIHLSPNYQPDIDVGKTWCDAGEGEKKADKMAYFGRPGCDSPKLLVESLMKQMR